MKQYLADKLVVIVGGTSGFGLEVARQVFEKGARLVLTGRDQIKLDNVITNFKEQGADISGYSLDVADNRQLSGVLNKIGSFDHLVSTAGGFMGGGFLDAPVETIRKAIEDKLFLNLAIARAAQPHLKEGGSMTFTAGSGGKPHNASGAIIGNDAVRTMVRGLAVETAPHGRVNAVAPTWTRTPLWRNIDPTDVDKTERYFAETIPLKRTARIDEVAMAYVFLMENTFINGQTIAVDGGLELV
jgi:NAD(P)-dependent dehydrogenase (short-subunit alcohol dehydrogenase family)